jgi:ribosomal protein S7
MIAMPFLSAKVLGAIATCMGLAVTLLSNLAEEKSRKEMKEELKEEIMDELSSKQ